jgi:hypothetical protein
VGAVRRVSVLGVVSEALLMLSWMCMSCVVWQGESDFGANFFGGRLQGSSETGGDRRFRV